MSTFDGNDLPDGFAAASGRGAHTGTITVSGPQQGADHFKAFGSALDLALKATDNAKDDVWTVTFTVQITPVAAADGADPGMVIEYTATLT